MQNIGQEVKKQKSIFWIFYCYLNKNQDITRGLTRGVNITSNNFYTNQQSCVTYQRKVFQVQVPSSILQYFYYNSSSKYK